MKLVISHCFLKAHLQAAYPDFKKPGFFKGGVFLFGCFFVCLFFDWILKKIQSKIGLRKNDMSTEHFKTYSISAMPFSYSVFIYLTMFLVNNLIDSHRSLFFVVFQVSS